MIPGKRINNKDELKKITQRMLKHINPEKKSSYEALLTWVRIDKNIYQKDWLRSEQEFYLLFKHPVHDYLDSLFIVNGNTLSKFMKDNIDVDRMEGVDLIVTSHDFLHSFVCNHDGEIYLVN